MPTRVASDSVDWAEGGRLVLPPHLSRRIFYTSFLILGSVASAVANDLPVSAAMAVSLLATSLNYWRHPIFGWRRNLDVFVATTSLFYQLAILSADAPAPARSLYFITVGCGGVCYLRSRWQGIYHGDRSTSSLYHCGLHLCGNIGNLVLYDAVGLNYAGWSRASSDG